MRRVDQIQVEVLPQNVGLKFVDDLLDLTQPKVVFVGRSSLRVQDLQIGIGLSWDPLIVAIEVICGVQRRHDLQPGGTKGIHVKLREIQLGPVGHGVPRVHLAVPHGESIVVLHAGPRITSPGVDEDLRPGVRVPVAAVAHQLRRELHEIAVLVIRTGHEVVVRPVRIRISVGGHVMVVHAVRVARLVVHVARVPFAVKRRYAVDAPVEVDPELGVLKPLRCGRVLVERCPGCGVLGLANSRWRPSHRYRRTAKCQPRAAAHKSWGIAHGVSPVTPMVVHRRQRDRPRGLALRGND